MSIPATLKETDNYLLNALHYMPKKQSNRCLYQSDFKSFINTNSDTILGSIHNAYHGQTLTSTNEAWWDEIRILQAVLTPWKDEDAEIIFEYDIPRLGKRIDVVLLLRGIIFCLEFKVGQKDALQTDVRSSNYLEEAATEIQVQGLEVDYACILWDADMRYDNGKWSFWKFNGKTQWIPEKNYETQKYMLNAYRVLLTRARQGIIICVPEGNKNRTPDGFPEDNTRLPDYYNPTYEYFKSIGIQEL